MMTEFKELSNMAVVELYNKKYNAEFVTGYDVLKFEQDNLQKQGYRYSHTATTKEGRCLGFTSPMKRGDKMRLWTGEAHGEFFVTEVWVKAPLLPTIIKVEAKKHEFDFTDFLEEPHKGHNFIKAMEEYDL